MSKQNGGIIGPDNVTTGGAFGTASGVFKLGEVTDLIKDSKWPTAGPASYQVANSLRFNDGSSDNLSKTFSSAGNRKTFTFSCWFKRGTITSIYNRLFSCYSDNNNRDEIYFHDTNDTLTIENVASSTGKNFVLNRVFRDVSAWYHFVLAVDTTQSTESNRLKIYINGLQETSFSTSNYPSLNADFNFANNIAHYIGRSGYSSGSNSYFDGYMAETVLVDGLQLAPTSLGEFDSDSGIWKPKDVSGLTFGTNGFYLDFKDSSALGNDAAGSNNFTVNNLTSIDQSIDTCTNNFATFNSLTPSLQSGGVVTYSEGNTKIVTSYSNTNYLRYPQAYTTMGVTSGKWYAEFKIGAIGSAAVGIANTGEFGSDGSSNPYAGYAASGAVYTNSGEYRANNGSAGSQGTYTENDIIGCALDMDNLKIYWHKNGTYINSGDPTSGSTGTGARAVLDPTTPGGFYVFTAGSDNSGVATIQINLGSPPYSVSSGNADGNGFGNFEYAPPSGYLALCTNNLNA